MILSFKYTWLVTMAALVVVSQSQNLVGYGYGGPHSIGHGIYGGYGSVHRGYGGYRSGYGSGFFGRRHGVGYGGYSGYSGHGGYGSARSSVSFNLGGPRGYYAGLYGYGK
ncbi:neuropeptide-like protein 31 [Penaeus monodon]|uniref:neuropeptide-like protein 31 n=1 Tax=Penaeus monodon TaxID=6687 RepID=UPI0018A6FAF9|nr:neuropeptide-like protein 31 [Penaeus monodon]